MQTIFTIGHSTHTLEEFVRMLQAFEIRLLVDVRFYPGSKRFPYFNKEALEVSMPAHGFGYLHYKSLGGRRKPLPGSINTRWRHPAFRGYADYMETDEFKTAIISLEKEAGANTTAYMCSEAVWWSCHRSLISDDLKLKGWTVMHIMGLNKATEHPYTAAARIENGILRYDEQGLFDA